MPLAPLIPLKGVLCPGGAGVLQAPPPGRHRAPGVLGAGPHQGLRQAAAGEGAGEAAQLQEPHRPQAGARAGGYQAEGQSGEHAGGARGERGEEDKKQKQKKEAVNPLEDTWRLLGRFALHTVRSLALVCSSLTSTIFSEPILRQSHTARQRQINSNKYSVSFLGPR